ncbi:hypothetical protein D3C80_546420 [compost metagenome]
MVFACETAAYLIRVQVVNNSHFDFGCRAIAVAQVHRIGISQEIPEFPQLIRRQP